ncbi:MAG: hypothetical protein U0531_04685 [Dehalococcoidia bacterium]
MIGRGVEIGYGCEIARSHIGDGAIFHHNYVGDSVIDRNVGLGFGTVTGNWPFYPPPVRSTVSGARLRTGMEKFGHRRGRQPHGDRRAAQPRRQGRGAHLRWPRRRRREGHPGRPPPAARARK